MTMQVRSRALVWIEELIEIAETEASCGLFSLLKREDEKFVTETAYARPMFAEDVARAVAQRLKRDRRITWFQVESENQESIHNHNAYAMVLGGNEEIMANAASRTVSGRIPARQKRSERKHRLR